MPPTRRCSTRRTQQAWARCSASRCSRLFPFVASEYWLYLACLVAINVASATGLNILTGYTGLVSLGQAAFMGAGRLHRRDPADCGCGTPLPAQPARRRRRRDARRAGRRHAVAARQGALPRDRDDRRRRSSRTSCFANLRRSPAAPPGLSLPPAQRLRHRARHLVPPLLADRAGHAADAARRRQPVPHPHRPRLHRHPRPRHLGRGARHPAAALQAAVVRASRRSTPASPAGCGPTSSASSRPRASRC